MCPFVAVFRPLSGPGVGLDATPTIHYRIDYSYTPTTGRHTPGRPGIFPRKSLQDLVGGRERPSACCLAGGAREFKFVSSADRVEFEEDELGAPSCAFTVIATHGCSTRHPGPPHPQQPPRTLFLPAGS